MENRPQGLKTNGVVRVHKAPFAFPATFDAIGVENRLGDEVEVTIDVARLANNRVLRVVISRKGEPVGDL